jgi:ribosome biogenesis GTPase
LTGHPPRGEAAMLESGVVTAANRRHFDVETALGDTLACVVKGRSAQIAVGDGVEIARVTGRAVIESVAPRTNLVYRSDAFRQKLLAANVTQIMGVVAPELTLDEELIHRWMVAAEALACRFVVVANKKELPGFPALRARMAPIAALGYPVIEVTALQDAAPVLPWLDGMHTVLVGQSGMGKSTLINGLVPTAAARTTEVSASLQAGRHTTTSTTLYRLPALGSDAWIVDSPGMKAFGLAHLEPAEIAAAFVEVRPFLGTCRFRDCRHDQEPGCAVRAGVFDGRIAPHRLALLHALMHEAEGARDPALGGR